MPIVKRASDMLAKYRAKYSGENVTAALNAVKPIMEARYEAGASVIYDIVERTRALLNSLGVPSTLWGVYLSFAQSLARRAFSFSDATLAKEAAALKAQWVTGYGADASIIDQIINLVIGTAPAY